SGHDAALWPAAVAGTIAGIVAGAQRTGPGKSRRTDGPARDRRNARAPGGAPRGQRSGGAPKGLRIAEPLRSRAAARSAAEAAGIGRSVRGLAPPPRAGANASQ